MVARGQSILTSYVAWNTSTNTYATGDGGNHTLRLFKDGTEAAPTNASTEIDATNMPGIYALALTSAETTFNVVTLGGKSSTSNVVLIGKDYLFEPLPVGGFLSSTAQIGVNVVQYRDGTPNVLQNGLVQAAVLSGLVNSNVTQWLGSAPSALQAGAVQAAVVSGAASGVLTTVNANLTQVNGAAAVTSSAQLGVNVVTFAGNPTGVTNIDRSTRSIALGTVSNASTTTTITLSTISPANLTPSQYVGRIVNFDATTVTANLRGQSTNITASVTSSGGALTVTALTDAPVLGDSFSVT